MNVVDHIAQPVGLVRGVGETDAQLLSRVKTAYGSRPYQMYVPLLKLLNKLNLKSMKYLLAKAPNKWTP